jgi:hypothetical protein
MFGLDPAALLGRLSGRRGPPGGAGSPRIAVLGNCQGGAVATSMRLLLPGAEVTFHSVHGIERRFGAAADLIRAVSDYDLVFGSPFPSTFRDGGDFGTLRAETGLRPIPIIVFPAFHPDAIYAGDITNARRLLKSPLRDYNSALVLFGFLEKLSADQTVRLFQEDAFRLVGYLDTWESAQAALLHLGREASYDLTADLLRWTRRGVFMHVINHPRMFVINDLARGLLAKAGVGFDDCDLDAYAGDEIVRLGAWPVYPPIAAQFGAEGSYVFSSRLPAGKPPRRSG